MAMRCFVAVELDRTLQRALAGAQDGLRRHLGSEGDAVKWVRPEQIHLTLKFLGDTEDRLIREVCVAVSEVAAEFDPFSFTVADVGCFPPRGAARVLWAGVGDGHEDLEAVQEMLEVRLADVGFALEARRFSAHLTLARIKLPRSGHAAREAVEAAGPEVFGVQAVERLVVFQSVLDRAGPTYTVLHHAPLGS